LYLPILGNASWRANVAWTAGRKRVRELLSVAPNQLGIGGTISRDDRQIHFSLVTTEADIWLMTLQ
jgi:hypothetical protein